MRWAAVTAGNGRFYRATSWAEPVDDLGSLVFGESEDGHAWVDQPELLWPSAMRGVRLAVSGDICLVVGKAQNSTVDSLLVGNNHPTQANFGNFVSLGRTHGESCVGVEALPDRPGFFRVGGVVSQAEWKTWIVDGRTLQSQLESV